MARVSMVLAGSQGRLLFYNIDAMVGPGGANRRDDVLLVQYFLHESFKSGRFASRPFPGELKVDGVPGPQTFAAIQHFQTVLKTAGSGIATDGRVDPPVGEQTRGAISHTQYTILFLNLGYKTVRPGDWPNVSKAADCPGELRAALREPAFIS